MNLKPILREMKDTWDQLPKFLNIFDVPNLPKTDQKEWVEFFVPKLIECGAIPKKELIHGQIYIGKHRRGKVAKWDAEKNHFIYKRDKFGMIYDDFCNHFEDDDGFDLFVPLKIGTIEEFIKNTINK